MTNPPIDPIREELVMSVETTIGPEQNLFDETPLHCAQLHLKSPMLTNDELEQVKALDDGPAARDHLADRLPCRQRR